MGETSTLYLPGQAKTDTWVLYPEVGTYAAEPEDYTEVLESYAGSQQRRIVWPFGGRMHFAFRTMKLSAIQSRQMRDFMRSVRGRAIAFNFFDFLRQSYLGENMGIATGGATLTVPFRDLRNVTAVYDDGVSVNYAITADYGSGREARITWTGTIPESGSVITFDGEGNKRYVVTREADRLVNRPFAGGEAWNDAVSAADLQFDMTFLEMI